MSARPGPLQTDPTGVLFGTKRVHVVDGSVLPDLPAQNSTLTIMANARRVALIAFVEGGVASPGDGTARLGADRIHPGTIEVNHHELQYESSRLAAAYHRR